MTTTDTMAADRAWLSLLDRLNRQSVTRHFDAYGDIDWDSPELALDPEDPRWELAADDPLGGTAWYQGLPAATRARLGCELVASKMKIGLVFESILKRGLLEFASTLPNRAPEFRYAYHEIIEEAQHSLMFQEFVNRSGFDAAGLPAAHRFGSRRIVRLGRRFPQLFFLFVLGGEDPIDYVQRRDLRSDRDLHPLLARIMRIHVTEEARHLSFARHYLKRTVPGLPRRRRVRLAVAAPVILGTMAQMMLKPSGQIVARYSIPRAVVAQAYTRNPRHRADTVASLDKVRKLCDELGLTGAPYRVLWRRLGLEAAGAGRLDALLEHVTVSWVSDSITWEAPDGDHPARRVSRRSMAAVAAGRKDEWLALFAPDAVVEDPVGPSMMDPSGTGHHGHEGIGRWWDKNFGAVSRFHFRITDSFANGPCCANIASITMWLGDSGATMLVDCVVIYTVGEDGLITSIRAHWEPDRAMATITSP